MALIAPSLALGMVAAAEGLAALARFEDRRRQYVAAGAHAARLGRPLVVVGDPDAGMHTRLARAYGCGDVTLDLAGAPGCPVSFAVDITRPVYQVPTDSSVVYVSCVLEYVPDAAAAWRELLRMAGRSENIYLVRVGPATCTAALYPGACNTLARTADGGLLVRPVGPGRRVAYGAALAALAAATLL